MNIPFYNIDRYYQKNKENILAITDAVFSSGKVIAGAEVNAFEENIAAFCGRKYAVSVGSCTDALYFALNACGVSACDEVIITGFSFIASVTPVLRSGAVPVFVDIDPDFFTMDLGRIEAVISHKTKAIIAVHLFGQMLNMNALAEIAGKHHLVLIEDAAQALGSSYNGTKAGSTGQMSCISFDPSKIISTFGSGGIVLTDDESLFQKALSLRYHGKSISGDFETQGYNSRLNTLQAAIASYQLENIEQIIADRNRVANKYTNAFSRLPQVKPPAGMSSSVNIFHKYVIKTEQRNELARHLKNNGIELMVHYSKALFEYGIFSSSPFKTGEIKHIHEIKGKVLSLPIFPELTEEETDYVIQKVQEYFS